MSDEWTPSTEQVRSHYVFNQVNLWDPECGEAFDRWLADRDAEVTRHDRVLLSQVRSEADELRRQGYPVGVLLRLLADVTPISEDN